MFLAIVILSGESASLGEADSQSKNPFHFDAGGDSAGNFNFTEENASTPVLIVHR
jgi:hypothetical protein